MHTRSFIIPQDYPLGQVIRGSLTTLDGLTVNATGFEGIEAKHISKIVPLVGGKYTEVFTSAVSVLVCRDGGATKSKMELAQHLSIPIVTERWLWSALNSQSRADFRSHLLNRPQDRLVYGDKSTSRKTAPGEFAEVSTVPLQRGASNQRTEQRLKAVDNRNATGAVADDTKKRLDAPVLVHQETGDDTHGREDGQPNGAWRATSSGRSETQEGSYVHQARPLREVSPTSARRNGRPVEHAKSAIRTTDGASSMEDPRSKENAPTAAAVGAKPADIEAINGQLREILNEHSKRKAAGSRATDIPKTKNKLIGRALSNLSNASSKSNVRRSRASSIDSMNTDGIGSEIPPMPSVEKESGETASVNEKSSFSFTGRAKTTLAGMESAPFGMDDPDLARAGDFQHELEAPPQMTQLGYEDPEEAILLREKLAASRKKRSKKSEGQKEGDDEGDSKPPATRAKAADRKIRDDDILAGAEAGWGAGRRTRHKQRSPPGRGIKGF